MKWIKKLKKWWREKRRLSGVISIKTKFTAIYPGKRPPPPPMSPGVKAKHNPGKTVSRRSRSREEEVTDYDDILDNDVSGGDCDE